MDIVKSKEGKNDFAPGIHLPDQSHQRFELEECAQEPGGDDHLHQALGERA